MLSLDRASSSRRSPRFSATESRGRGKGARISGSQAISNVIITAGCGPDPHGGARGWRVSRRRLPTQPTPGSGECNVVNVISYAHTYVRTCGCNRRGQISISFSCRWRDGDDRDCVAPITIGKVNRYQDARAKPRSRKSVSRLRVPVGRRAIKLLRLTPYRRAECLEPSRGMMRAVRHEAWVYCLRAVPLPVPKSPSSSSSSSPSSLVIFVVRRRASRHDGASLLRLSGLHDVVN